MLPKAVSARVAVEAGIADYWFKYVGLNGAIVGMTTFGESAPAEQLFEEFGFTVDNVVAKGKSAAVITFTGENGSLRRPVFMGLNLFKSVQPNIVDLNHNMIFSNV